MEDKKFPSCGSVAFSSVRSKPQSVNPPPPPKKKNKHGCADVASVQRKPRATGTSRSKAASHKKKQPQNILKITTGERTLRWRSVSCANTSRRRVRRQVVSNNKKKQNTGAQKLHVGASLAATTQLFCSITLKKIYGCVDCALERLTARRATNVSRSFVA